MMKEKFWSFSDDFSIKDANGQPIFFVKGKAFSWGDKLSFQDLQGNELAFISQKLLSFKPRFEIFRNGELFAEVTKEFSWFKKEFLLDVPGPNDYSINGSFWQRNYTFERSGRVVAQVSREYFTWTDTYGVDIVDGEDDVAILAAVIVIDQVLHDDRHDGGGISVNFGS
ncbi:LURP-one-related/scramblase family protein [Cerasicoccus fimbriatus]|uniref:LURP-one-related/scramblase family protein n=1 Tax=Cerasicoccus fimbriatus TaxID=3014554 RepID=UPI0022B5140F|nr:LURP-one-related family protein [Cerasicoccus sp. TK19100]